MKKFEYSEVGKEIGWNFSKINPQAEHLSSYNYYKEVVANITPETIMLDVGCGSAEKTIRFFSLAKQVVAVDLEPEMLQKAQANFLKYYSGDSKMARRFEFLQVNADGVMPFEDEYFDLVVSRHCGANMNEVYRVLKKGGVFISEDVSCDDCQELKNLFGRGQCYGDVPHYKKVYEDCLDAGFSEVNFLKFEEIEYYKNVDELKYLLSYTPILNGFDDEIDSKLLGMYVEKNSAEKGIRLNRRLYAFKLVK